MSLGAFDAYVIQAMEEKYQSFAAAYRIARPDATNEQIADAWADETETRENI